ncbi:tannase/feruloyl esterase family alpha/beta hydrolase [Aestuariicella hydrocarbonica]|uniref:Tannase/feruloyl esterase family alpha/beta hydrolase n=1 Tax=Pseudomaricurvus hydrocarbonicus TaxID=1470433 RepID=A0A9E5MLC7_9GAMM|nr:DUF6351 family protein [Aestuariicella hydrocarbonica]NHO66802.1 tannase/feruloyl esterase family alpha/beta hydrolase [Aestuariicella hydrocarbonica]
MMKKLVLGMPVLKTGIWLGAFFLSPMGLASQSDFADACRNLKSLTLEGYDIEVTEAAYIDRSEKMSEAPTQSVAPKGFKPYCSLKGYFEKRVGVNDKPYAIGFGLALPESWNGRFLFQGGGGLNGLIREPLGALAAGETPALFQGFAVASTDSGHQSDSLFNVEFFEDQQSLLNFYDRAVVKTTELAKKIVANHYGQPSLYNYFVGCSTGGREAMSMSQRYPNVFDGIVAGAPAMRTNYSEVADLWSAVTLQALVDDQQPEPFSVAQQSLIVDGLLKACDARDGIRDGMVADVVGCDFSPAALQCSAETEGGTCLTAAQVKALDKAFAGPRDIDGRNLYPGFFWDTGVAAKAEHGIPGLLQGVAGPLGKSRMGPPFDLQREIAIARDFPLAPGNATSTQLSTFAHVGGKLMFFHGASDPWFSAQDTLQYYQRLAKRNGGLERVQQWSRLYLVPGMGHCHGGESTLDQFDMLNPMVNWVEQGKAPEAVEATGKAFPGRSRSLCPYPAYGHYLGRGDSEEAVNFDCKR